MNSQILAIFKTLTISIQLIWVLTLVKQSRSAVSRPAEKPRIFISPESKNVIAGETTLFMCFVEGTPAPTLRWNDEKIKNQTNVKMNWLKAPKGSVLEIPYTPYLPLPVVIECNTHNQLGEDIKSAVLNVYLNREVLISGKFPSTVAPSGFPRFLNNFSVTVAKKNDHVSLQCNADGSPHPQVRWFKHHIPIDTRADRYELGNDDSLWIKQLREEDEGSYECEATNLHGSLVSPSQKLMVRGDYEATLQLLLQNMETLRPHISPILPKKKYIKPNGSIELECRAVGQPVPDVKWFSGSVELTKSVASKANDSNKALITLYALAASQNLTCEAESNIGSVSHTVQVIVKDLPDSPKAVLISAIEAYSAQIAFLPVQLESTAGPVSYYIIEWVSKKEFSSDLISEISDYRYHGSNQILSKEEHEHILKYNKDSKTMFRMESNNPTIIPLESLIRLNPVYQIFVDQKMILCNLTDLKPYTEYSVWARSFLQDGTSSPSSPVQNFTTKEAIPRSAPRNVRAYARSKMALAVNWKVPEYPNGVIKEYIVYSQRGNDSSTIRKDKFNIDGTNSDHTFFVSKLEPDEIYSISVSSVNSAGEGPRSEAVTILTTPGVLPAPQNFRAQPQSHDQILLEWDTPVTPNTELLHSKLLRYELRFRSIDSRANEFHSRKINALPTIAFVNELLPSTKYFLQLAAVTDQGNGIFAETTTETKPFIAPKPENVTTIASGERQIIVSWQIADFSQKSNLNSASVIRYEITSIPTKETGAHIIDSETHEWLNSERKREIQISPQRGDIYTTLGSEIEDKPRLSEIIDGLRPNTYYVFHVRVVTTIGAGLREITRPIKTWSETPSQPLELKFSTEKRHQISVTWAPPKIPSLFLEENFYVVTYNLVRTSLLLPVIISPHLKKAPTTLQDQIPLKFISGKLTTRALEIDIPLESLLAMATAHQIGLSTNSTIKLEETLPKGSVRDLRFKNKLVDFELSWQPPFLLNRGGLFNLYQLDCNGNLFNISWASSNTYTVGWNKKSNGLTSFFNEEWPMAKVAIIQLLPHVTGKVQCKVRAKNLEGFGPWSETEFIYLPNSSTGPQPPLFVQGLLANYTSPSTYEYLLITWSVPSDSLIQTIDSTKNQPEFSSLAEYTKFAVYWAIIDHSKDSASLFWNRFVTDGPVTSANFSIGYLGFERNLMVRVAGVNARGIEGKASSNEMVIPILMRTSKLESPLLIDVTCEAKNENSFNHNALTLRLSWSLNWKEFPQIQPNDILHFKLNYSGVSQFESYDARTIRRAQHQREQIAPINAYLVRNYNYEFKGLMPNTLYRIGIIPMFKKFPNSISAKSLKYLIECPKTSYAAPKFVPRPWLINETKLVISLGIRRPLAEYGDPNFYAILYAIADPQTGIFSKQSQTNVYAEFSRNELWRSSQETVIQIDRTKLFNSRRLKRSINLETHKGNLIFAFAVQACIQNDNNECTSSEWLLPTSSNTYYKPPLTALDTENDDPLWPSIQYYSSDSNQNDPQGDETLKDGRPNWHFPEDQFLDRKPLDKQTNGSLSLFVVVVSVIAIVILISGLSSIFVFYSRKQKSKKSFKNGLKQESVIRNKSDDKYNGLSLLHTSTYDPSTLKGPHSNTVLPVDYQSQCSFPMEALSPALSEMSNPGLYCASNPVIDDCSIRYPCRVITPQITGNVIYQGSMPNREAMTPNIGQESVALLRSHTLNGSIKSGHSGLFNDVQKAFANHALATRGLGSTQYNSSCNGPIAATSLPEHLNMLKMNNSRLLATEFESIDPGGQYSWEYSNRPVNRNKNRYANVVAYDHSRVVLSIVESIDSKGIRHIDPDSDYINANYIDGYYRKNAYIATQVGNSYWVNISFQGPLANTMCDFWRMVWEQRSSIIVAMTRLEEKVRTKCEQYWPPLPRNESSDTNSSDDGSATHFYENIQVTFLNSLELAYYTVRTFSLKNLLTNEERQIRQFQYSAWPDHGSPCHPGPILMFIKRIKSFTEELIKENPFSTTGPTIVHCSAGVGRTGAYIAIDILLAQLLEEQRVGIYQVVRNLRSQRNFMVQTQDQYEFIFDSLVEAISAQNEVLVEHFPNHLNQLCQVYLQGRQPLSGLVTEFRKLQNQTMLYDSMLNGDQTVARGLLCPVDPKTETRLVHPELPDDIELYLSYNPNKEKRLIATLPINMAKNQSLEIVPYNSNRFRLNPVKGVDGSDYINASFIDGYLSRLAYIATQTPLDATVPDFWRMIWESRSCIIVKLNSIINSEYAMETTKPYWPRKGAAKYGTLVVEPVAEFAMTSFILREFRLTDTRDGHWRTIRQFDVSEALMHLATYTPIDFESSMQSRFQHPLSIFEDAGRDLLSKPQHKQAACSLLECIGQAHTTKNQFGIDGPITVHCDVGAGRTGIFLAVSLLIQRTRMEGIVDLYQTVKMLRWQRRGLVESVEDYAFCHAAILEYLTSFDHIISN